MEIRVTHSDYRARLRPDGRPTLILGGRVAVEVSGAPTAFAEYRLPGVSAARWRLARWIPVAEVVGPVEGPDGTILDAAPGPPL